MAIIGRIQEKGRYVLVGIVGLALLTFIFTSFFDAAGSNLDQGNIGTIGGEALDPEKLSAKTDEFLLAAEQQAQQSGQPVTEQQREQARENAWRALVSETLLSKEYDALGIDVSKNEVHDYLYGEKGFPLRDDIRQNFSDSSGIFIPSRLDEHISNMENAKDEAQRVNWEKTMTQVKEQRKQEKYLQLVGQGAYVTKLEAKESYNAKNEKKSIAFVFRSFADTPKEQVKITDEEVRTFYEEHKDDAKYKLQAGRVVRFFDVAIQPSKADSAAFNEVLAKLKRDFEKATDDSLFVLANSETRMGVRKNGNPYRSQDDPNAKGATYPAFMDSIIKATPVGSVVTFADPATGMQNIAKVLGFNTQSLSARHILIPAQKADTKGSATAKKLADSLSVILTADTTRWAELVNTYSQDGGSKQTGGKYGDFSKDEFVPEFSGFVIANPVGKTGVVQTDYGFHIIQVLGKKDARIPLMAVINRTLVPSADTEADLKDKAYDMLEKLTVKMNAKEDLLAKLSLFDTLARKEGYMVRPITIDEKSPKVQGFQTDPAKQKILALAFDEEAEVGRLCDAPIADKGRYVIAMVASIRPEKGAPSYEDAYLRMKDDAIKEKIANKYKAQIGKERNLEKLAKKFNINVNQAEVIFDNVSIANAGVEPKIVGALFSGLKDNQTTLPLVGDNGVYVIKLKKTQKAPATANYEQDRLQMLQMVRGNVSSCIYALEERAEVYDNRTLLDIRVVR